VCVCIYIITVALHLAVLPDLSLGEVMHPVALPEFADDIVHLYKKGTVGWVLAFTIYSFSSRPLYTNYSQTFPLFGPPPP